MGKNEGKQRRKPLKRIAKIFTIFLAILLGIILILGIVLFVLYKSGKNKLLGSADQSVPVIINSEQDMLVAQEKANLTTVQWQPEWVAMDGNIYEYDKNRINLLFLGIDHAGGLNDNTVYENWNAGQADAIFILSLDPEEKTMKIIAVPRNSMVDLNIYNSEGEADTRMHNQICLQYGYAGGGENGLIEMKRAVSDLFYQLPIHGVTAIGYDAIPTINDLVGGVDVEVLEDIAPDPRLVKGNTVHLMGMQAYYYLQYRDLTQIGSPTLRLERQKQYLTVFVDAAKAKVKSNPLIVSEMYQKLSAYMNTDISLDQAVYMAMELLDYKFDTGAVYIPEGEDRAVPFIDEHGKEDFFDDYYLDEESVKRVMIEAFYKQVFISETGY